MKETMYCPSERFISKVKNIYIGEKLQKSQTSLRTLQLTSTLYVNQEPIIFQVSKFYPWMFEAFFSCSLTNCPKFLHSLTKLVQSGGPKYNLCLMLGSTIPKSFFEREINEIQWKKTIIVLKILMVLILVNQLWLTKIFSSFFFVGFSFWKGLAFPQILRSLW